MNVDTGEIKELDKLTRKQLQSGKWIEVPENHRENLFQMNRKQRREYLKKNGQFKKGKWGWANP